MLTVKKMSGRKWELVSLPKKFSDELRYKKTI